MSLPNYLLWIDLETTGLDPRSHDVVELFAQATRFDDPFNPIRAGLSRVHHVLGYRVWDPLDDVVVAMHARSGLLDECRRSEITKEDVESELLRSFDAMSTESEPLVLAGSSVHFDLAFVRLHFPVFAKRLSHRVYDVSALKLFCCSIGMPYEKGEARHRAKDDTLASMEVARACHDWLARTFGDRRELALRQVSIVSRRARKGTRR